MDVYQIGISISMQNGVSAVLALIQKQMLGLNSATTQAAAGFGRLRLAIAGATGVFVGAEILKGLGDLTKHGEKYTHQLELMKIAGMGVAEMQDAITAANKVSSTVMTSTPTENLQTLRELRMALASADVRPGGVADPAMATKEAVAHLETFQKISATMSSVLSREGKPFSGSGQAYELAKAAEMLGLTQNPKKFDAVLEGWSQAIIASGGKLQGADIFSNVKYLRGAGLGMDMEFITRILPSLAQEFKTGGGKGGGGAGQGGGAGNPLASMFQAIVGGTLSNKAVKALNELHMIDMSKVVFTKTGRVQEVHQGAVFGSDVAVHNPFEFVQKFLEPAMRKYTNVLEKNTQGEFAHPGELFGLLAHLIGNRTAQQVVGMMLLQQNRIAGDVGLEKSAFGANKAYEELVRRDPVLALKAYDEQLERLTTDIGKLLAPMKTEVIFQFAKAFRFAAEVIERHPVAAKWIIGIIGGFGALLVVVGSLAVAVAAFSALGLGAPFAIATAGLIALGGAIGYLSDKTDLVKYIQSMFLALNDPAFYSSLGTTITGKIHGVWTMLEEALHGTTARISAIASGIWTSLMGLATSLSEGLSGMIKSITAWFASLPSRMLSAVTGGPALAASGSATVPAPGEASVPASSRLPPTAQPESRGTPTAPLHVWVNNQTSGRDILHGTAGGMARSIGGTSSGTTWTNPLSMPQLTPTPH